MFTSTVIKKHALEYLDTVGFVADQGGRGFHLPVDMAIRNDGRIYVASRSHYQSPNIIGIQIVSINHEFFGQVGSHGTEDGEMISPSALAIDNNDRLYLADDILQRITVYGKNNAYMDKWGTAGSADGEIDGPSGLVFDSDNNLLVVDHKNHRVQKFTSDGYFLGKFGSFGKADGQFDHPWGITVDAENYIYVADWRNDRIQKFTSDGKFVSKFGRSGTGPGEFNRPSNVTVDSLGFIYVADWGNQRVQMMAADGTFILALRGQATLSPWATEYLESNADEAMARSSYVPVYDTGSDDPNEISARIEPYFWDPVTVALDNKDRLHVLETGRHRFQVYSKVEG